MSKAITGLTEETHKRFRLYTIKSGSKNADEALKTLLKDAIKEKSIT